MIWLQAKWKQYMEMSLMVRVLIPLFIVSFGSYMVIHHRANNAAEQQAQQVKIEAASHSGDGKPDSMDYRTLPNDTRNQGLEDVVAQLAAVKAQLAKERSDKSASGPAQQAPGFQGQPSQQSTPQQPLATGMRPLTSTQGSGSVDLDSAPQPVDATAFNQPGGTPGKKSGSKAPSQDTSNPFSGGDNGGGSPTVRQHQKANRPAMTDWGSSQDKSKGTRPLVIPAYSGLESVMLTGVDAMPTGANGANGSVTKATSVGTPFVTRVKGNATLPNNWRVADLGDCFIGGTGIGVLSSERMDAIATSISCVAKDGRVWEAPIQAYGVDIDGIQGIAGHVVSKQGRLLLQSALSGLASGLSSALSPTSVSAYNSNSTGGTTAYQTANIPKVAEQGFGTGLSNAATELSKFYLQYASQVFPVVEVPSTTRITWIIRQTITLKLKKRITL